MKFSTIIIDWKQTLYSPEEDCLIEGAVELLEMLQESKSRLILVGKGDEDMYIITEKLNVKKYFDDILFVGSEKEPDHFNRFMLDGPGSTLIIGDKLSSEIELGNRLGSITIQIKQGKFANEEPANEFQKPNKVFENLRDTANFLSLNLRRS